MAKRKIDSYIFNPGISLLDNKVPNGYSLIKSNTNFIIEEATAYIEDRVIEDTTSNAFPLAVAAIQQNIAFLKEESVAYIQNQVLNAGPDTIWENYTYDVEKCKRDIEYNLVALWKDLKYGGNERSRYVQSLYWNDDIPQIDGDRQVEVAVYVWLLDTLTNFVYTNTPYTSLQVNALQVTTASTAEAGAVTKTNNLLTSLQEVIANGLSSLPTLEFGLAFAEYTYNKEKCKRDIKYVLDAYLHDIRYGGNASTYDTVSLYWEGNIPQIDGSRQPEIQTHLFIKNLIIDNIIENTTWSTLQSPQVYSQVIDLTKTTESTVADSVNLLYNLLADVINNGLSVLPDKVSGLGYIRVQQRFREEDLLIITNVSQGEVLYTFNDPTKLAECDFVKDFEVDDIDFKSFDQVTDTITTIKLYYDTSEHEPTDRLQIFVEDKEIRTRPYDFGTDAIERNRVANAQSMLDADFEYGLQPTKWQAIGMQRGYPSIYEIPGTEINVFSVTTDASSTTGNIGASIITVECTSPHNLSPGEPFTIKGLGGTALGIGRAEGSFTVYTTPTNNSFTFFAKSKVGTESGQVLSTTYTQLRKAGFYTGASIGSSTFTVASQGTSGTLTVPLNVPSGSDSIPFNGVLPEIGAPLDDPTGAIPVGAQVTATNGTGGVVTTGDLTVDVTSGSTQFDLLDTAGVTIGLAIDSGNGTASFVSNVAGQTVFLTDPLTADRVGSNVTYSNLPASLQGGATGTDATFDVLRSAGSYTTSIDTPGTGYAPNDVLVIPGNVIGGLSPDNDLFIQVAAVDGAGGITSITESGNASEADGSFPSTPSELNGGVGFGAVFDISALNNVYTVNLANVNFTDVTGDNVVGQGANAEFDVTYQNNVYSVIITNPGSLYDTGENLLIPGDQLNGTTPENDLLISITSVSGVGGILNISASGSAPDASNQYGGLTPVYSGIGGTGADFVIGTSGETYSISEIASPGDSYNVGETFTVPGDQLNGSSPTNDAVITIDAIDVNGGITSASVSGTALNYSEFLGQIADYKQGTSATFDISKNGTSWSASINNAGSNYSTNDEITIDVGQFGIAPIYSPTITVTSVGASGEIITVSVTGNSPNPGGENYVVNDRILIPGSFIPNGVDPNHDIIVTITSVNVDGAITGFTSQGTAPDVNEDYLAVPYTTAGNGINALIDVNKSGVTYTPSFRNIGSDFVIGDQLVLSGANLGGVTPANDLVITVSDVDVSGGIIDFGISGNARNGFLATFINSTAIQGTGATFDVENATTVYSVVLGDAGSDYFVNQQLTIAGNLVGGVTPGNDITITVTQVGADGSIQNFSFAGTGGDGTGNYTALTADYAPLNGNGAAFDVNRAGNQYIVTLSAPGSDYNIGNTLLIDGSELGGESGINDLTIAITDVGPINKEILSINSTGTPTASSAIQFLSTVTFTELTIQELPANTDIDFSELATIQVDFDSPHGLVPGNTFIVSISSDDGVTDGTGNNHILASGAYIATSVPSLTSLTYQAKSAGTIDTSGDDDLSGVVYARPDSFFVHRPYDGGVQLGTGGPQHGAQAIRQSKNYIRYQSGKGIMYTTGALFAPSYDILTASSVGTTPGSLITFEIDDSDHGLQVGGVIRVSGIITPGYNGLYTVSDIVSERVFKVAATTTLGSTIPIVGPQAQISTKEWHGATVRAGAFDEQNGIFWAYDGVNLSVVQRSSTFQLAGLGTIKPDTNTIIGQNCRFLDQVSAGDRIVIRGMTHVVSKVENNNEMYVTPDYRGTNEAINAKICLIKDKQVLQNDFNLDPVNGNGKSGYDVDVSYMQMIGIQYSWYGAGFIDYMLRGADGNFIFCHRMRNSNVNTEAFMRSGNLPVRYEVTNEGANGKLAEDINDSQTTIVLEDTSFFPPTGATLYIDNEIITYTNISGNTLTGCTRGTSLTNFQAGAQRQYTAGPATPHSARTGVVIISNTVTPIISHWGSAFITDGGFDDDRGYIFSYAAQGQIISTTRSTAFLLRLAPSVSNAITGDLGDRELLNRAQLLLNGIEVTSDPLAVGDEGGIIIEGVLNPSNYPVNPNAVSWSSLNTQAQGGQPSFAQIAAGAGIDWNTGGVISTASIDTISSPSTASDFFAQVYNNESWFEMWTDDAVQFAIGSEPEATRFNTGQQIFNNGTTITGVSRNYTLRYDYAQQVSRSVDRFFISSPTRVWPGDGRYGQLITVTARLLVPEGRILSLLFLESEFTATGATTGTPLDATDTNFPPGSVIEEIERIQHGTDAFSRVKFNQPGDITAGDTVVFNLQAAAFAQPGETIFKFIAVPGERSELDLSPIKELTNTSLGGRGTFPNGPDVLAINVRKTNGLDIKGNVILKWGEAQA